MTKETYTKQETASKPKYRLTAKIMKILNSKHGDAIKSISRYDNPEELVEVMLTTLKRTSILYEENKANVFNISRMFGGAISREDKILRNAAYGWFYTSVLRVIRYEMIILGTRNQLISRIF